MCGMIEGKGKKKSKTSDKLHKDLEVPQFWLVYFLTHSFQCTYMACFFIKRTNNVLYMP